jgi:hypothetical protein
MATEKSASSGVTIPVSTHVDAMTIAETGMTAKKKPNAKPMSSAIAACAAFLRWADDGFGVRGEGSPPY